MIATAADRHWAGLAAAPRPLRVDTRSLFVTMRDGVRLAIDVHVPRDSQGRVPAIVRQTRYLRALDAHPLAALLGLPAQFDINGATRRRFLEAGYAWLDVDVRGTGASGGAWTAPWFDDQIADGAEIATWITRQPWSSGAIGTLGISYDGTCAETLLANAHPAVRAAAPMFSLYDVYADVAFPGGVHLAWFTEHWARYNRALDHDAIDQAMVIPLWLMARAAHASPRPRGRERVLARLGALRRARFEQVVGGLLTRAFRGVRHVEERGDGVPTALCLAERAHNLDVHAGAQRIVFRDDVGVHPEYPERTIDSLSPHQLHAPIAASGAAIYSISGWRDGAYQSSAIKRHALLGGRLTLGPWAHTGRLRIHAFELAADTEFDHAAELLDFFDEHLKGVPSRGDGAPVHYFTLGAERWRSARAWPPPSEERAFFLSTGRRLVDAPEAADAADPLDAAPDTGTGERSRWRSLLSLVPGDYPDRAARDERLLFYETPPLERDAEMTGSARATLFAAWDGEDGQLFVYLEDVRPDGAVSYVTEGQLRALHRKSGPFSREEGRPVAPAEVAKIEVELLPVSYLFRRGHRVRVVLAPCDADHFAPPGTTRLRVHHGHARPSRVLLPFVRAS